MHFSFVLCITNQIMVFITTMNSRSFEINILLQQLIYTDPFFRISARREERNRRSVGALHEDDFLTMQQHGKLKPDQYRNAIFLTSRDESFYKPEIR